MSTSSNSGNSTSLYGEASTPIPDSSGNVVVRGDLYVLSGNILTTATTGNIFPANATTINLGLAATAMNIGAASGSTTINNTLFAPGADFGNITVGIATDNTITTTSGLLVLKSATGEIDTDTTNIISTNSATFNLLNFPTTVNAFLNATSLNMGETTGTTTINNNLTVDGTDINLAPSTNFLYSENNNRTNRPEVQSTSGNTSGFRVRAPNTTTSAQSILSVNNSSDSANTEFLAIQSRGSALGDTFRILTGEYIANVFSASNKSISFTDGSNTYATVNPAGPTIGTDLTTKTYVDNAVATTGVTSITGTANQVIASSATGAVTLSLPQSIATTSNVTFADITATDDLTVQGNNVNLAQATTIGYDDSNNRANRPSVQSTTGNSSGLRILAPNATTSAQSNMTVFGSNDIDNGEFLNIRASGSTTAPFSIRTGLYTAGVLGASGEEINFVDNVTTYASVNPAGPTNSTDLTTKTYVDALVAGGVTSITGTADQVIASSATGAVTLSLPQSIATTSTPTFAGATLDAVTVGVDSAQTISTTSGNLVLQTAAGVNAGTITMASGVNGNITLAPNGTGKVIISDGSYVLGQLIATPTLAYAPPASALTTLSGANGLAIASSTGNGAAVSIRYSSGDTTAGTNSSANILMAGTSGTSTAPGGIANNQVAGNINIDGYTAGTSNNFAQQIATANQGAGTAAITPLQIQGYARQAFTNSVVLTTAVTGASGTGTVATLTFTTQNTAPYVVGQTVAIAGMTPAGYNNAAAVITAATTSSISYANTTTGFTSGGTIAAVNTVTAAGMGFRIRGFANSTNMTAANRYNFMDLRSDTTVFKSNAYTFANEVITGSTLTATNYMTITSTGTTITGAGLSQITRTTVGTPTVVESRPSFNIQLTRSDQAAPTSGDGTGFRSRVAGSNGTNYTMSDLSSNYSSTGDYVWSLNLANGDQTGATFSGLSTIQSKISETTIAAGVPSATPGVSTATAKLTIDNTKVTAAVPFVFPNYTVAAAGAITGGVGWQIAISDSPVAAGRMAFWSTTATAGWRYIDTNLAI